MEAGIEALEPRTFRDLLFLLGNHVGNGSDGVVFGSSLPAKAGRELDVKDSPVIRTAP